MRLSLYSDHRPCQIAFINYVIYGKYLLWLLWDHGPHLLVRPLRGLETDYLRWVTSVFQVYTIDSQYKPWAKAQVRFPAWQNVVGAVHIVARLSTVSVTLLREDNSKLMRFSCTLLYETFSFAVINHNHKYSSFSAFWVLLVNHWNWRWCWSPSTQSIIYLCIYVGFCPPNHVCCI